MSSRNHKDYIASADELRSAVLPRRAPRRRVPSASGYMVVAAATAAALFFLLWWMLQEEENPWIPAGLAASVVMIVAASARGVMLRRAHARHVLEEGTHDSGVRPVHLRTASSTKRPQVFSQGEVLRALEKRAAEANASEGLPEGHREVFQLCSDFLADVEQALNSPALSAERRFTLRARQERARALQKAHLLAWARDSAVALTHQAQQRSRLHEKVETANRALDCIDTALKKYPGEEELLHSALVVRDFIAKCRVAHWVELAQRASFKGHYRRAIDCYRDALFYLTRDDHDSEREAAAQQITREIELLRARMATHSAVDPESEPQGPNRS